MDKMIIYVAGNPDAYPIEYYHRESATYQGMIPELLQQFADESGYDIQYYAAGASDQRAELAKKYQVDLISGCLEEDEFLHVEGEEITIFETVTDGEPSLYRILVTKAAPSAFVNEFRAFLDGVTEEAKTGFLLDAAEQYIPYMGVGMRAAFAGLGAAVLILLIILLEALRRYRRRMRLLEQTKETDEVTGIGNADHLARYYNTLLRDENRILYSMFYFYIDTDRIERSSSRRELELFLGYTASVLQEYSADTDILARVADGGFALLRQTVNIQEAEQWIVPVLARIRDFSSKQAAAGSYNISAGIYMLKADDRDLNEILFNAMQSALFASRCDDDYRICTKELLRTFLEERKLQGQIERGFENEEFLLYIQFYVTSKRHRIVGGEALSRWNHPEKGLLSPGRFVPLMEREGIIERLDYYSLNKVCAFLEKLRKLGIRDFFISCNFSRKTFSSENFVEQCREIMDKYQFDRELLIFELTESTMVKNEDVVRKNIKASKKMGIRIALDDFGEGFSSLFDIQEYSFDGLKLDKRLVDNIGHYPGDVILRGMARLGHDLGLTVLAEGVESDEQVYALQMMGCDVFQGYRFHYPAPEWEVLRELLEGRKLMEEKR